MGSVFLEVLFDVNDCAAVNIQSRDEIEDDLELKLVKSELGYVSGGGGGAGKYNIDIEINDERSLEAALVIIKDYLVSINVPRSSKIVRYKPQKQEFSIYT